MDWISNNILQVQYLNDGELREICPTTMKLTHSSSGQPQIRAKIGLKCIALASSKEYIWFLQGTPERLTMHLVEEHSVVDPTYIEDFLLTYRTFLPSPMVVGKKLLEWFHDPSLRDKVHRHIYSSIQINQFSIEWLVTSHFIRLHG